MKIKPFAVEEWMNAYEEGARYNIAETCVDSVSMDELFQITGEDKTAFLQAFCARRLTYGDIVGSEALREGACGLYKTMRPDRPHLKRCRREILMALAICSGSSSMRTMSAGGRSVG